MTALSLTTDSQPGYYTPNQFFEVIDLGAGDAFTSDLDTGPITVGTVTVTPAASATPEPSTLSLLALGLAGIFAVYQLKRVSQS